MTQFRCAYELDQRLNAELVQLNQELYRSLPGALGEVAEIPHDEDGLPDAVRYYLIYVSSLVYGAADAALTLVLHNLGREARVFQRQIFECLTRATYYVENPAEARVALLSTAHQEKKLLDELNYNVSSERYNTILELSRKFETLSPGARTYREPPLSKLLQSADSDDLQRMYALNYRVTSLMTHASFNGAGAVFREDGISFDSRESLPNYVVANVTAYLLAFLELLNTSIGLNIEDRLLEFHARWNALEGVAAS